MSENTLRKPPRGWKAFFWRAPIYFYRVGLGWMLGQRFLLLNHIGRKSGQPRQAVLEVVDRTLDAYFVASGFGEKSHWFQNIMHMPDVDIQVGRRKINATAECLPVLQAKNILQMYAEKHPVALRELMKIVGLSYDGSEKELENIIRLVPIIKFSVK